MDGKGGGAYATASWTDRPVLTYQAAAIVAARPRPPLQWISTRCPGQAGAGSAGS